MALTSSGRASAISQPNGPPCECYQNCWANLIHERLSARPRAPVRMLELRRLQHFDIDLPVLEPCFRGACLSPTDKKLWRLIACRPGVSERVCPQRICRVATMRLSWRTPRGRTPSPSSKPRLQAVRQFGTSLSRHHGMIGGCHLRFSTGQTRWIMPYRNAVVSPNNIIPFSASSAPMSRQ